MEIPGKIMGLTIIVIGLDVAGFTAAQEPTLEVRTQVIISPLTGVMVNTGLFVPVWTPFLCQSYTGVDPPFVGVAVKVTAIPVQTGFAEAVIETDTGIEAEATMVMALEITGLLPVMQVAFEVSSQVMISPFAGEQIKTALFVPILVPLTFQLYTGAFPPFTGEAVKVTGVPGQNGFVGVEINTLAGRAAVTFMMILEDVTGLPLTQ